MRAFSPLLWDTLIVSSIILNMNCSCSYTSRDSSAMSVNHSATPNNLYRVTLYQTCRWVAVRFGPRENWIGLYRNNTNNETYWSDGNPSAFRSFEKDSPTNMYKWFVLTSSGQLAERNCHCQNINCAICKAPIGTLNIVFLIYSTIFYQLKCNKLRFHNYT